VLAVIYGRAIKRIAKKTQDALAEATSCADETFANMRSVRLFAWGELMWSRYSERVEVSLQLAIDETVARAGFFGFAGACMGGGGQPESMSAWRTTRIQPKSMKHERGGKIGPRPKNISHPMKKAFKKQTQRTLNSFHYFVWCFLR
jgi:ABC-type multidrug transport system fused ATPase/permease subunit